MAYTTIQAAHIPNIRAASTPGAAALGAEIKRPDLGFSVYFTSNPNHFCRFGARMRGVGMTETRALDAASLTPAGRQRGCTQTLDDVVIKTTKQ